MFYPSFFPHPVFLMKKCEHGSHSNKGIADPTVTKLHWADRNPSPLYSTLRSPLSIFAQHPPPPPKPLSLLLVLPITLLCLPVPPCIVLRLPPSKRARFYSCIVSVSPLAPLSFLHIFDFIPVFRIRDMLVRIQTNGSGSGSYSFRQ
jgi:hypothetical protein